MLEAPPYSCTEVKNFDLDKIGIKKRDSPFDREPRAALMYLISKKLARGAIKFYNPALKIHATGSRSVPVKKLTTRNTTITTGNTITSQNKTVASRVSFFT
jgi:hypothetical protein